MHKNMNDNCGEWVESIGVASGCGCNEVHKFPHNIPYSSCIFSYLAEASLLYVNFLKFWFLFICIRT